MKIIFLVSHVLSACVQCLVLPVLPYSARSRLVHWWSKNLLAIFSIDLIVHGPQELFTHKKSSLVVSNHISWIDIHVINAISPVIFVAKSDVASWPIFGWVARKIGTIFIVREKLSDIKRVLNLMHQYLSQNKKICIFPEGTSTDGKTVLNFRSNLFQAAINANVDVLPICIQYKEGGQYSDVTAFIGDMGLVDSIKKMMGSSKIEVHVHILDPISELDTRHNLASQAHQHILKKII
jgi:1-acyl-sn-glycerol-3-phosphate acyltransferase